MTPREFYEELTHAQQGDAVRLDIDARLKVGAADAMAARLLLWLEEAMPEDATQGDLDNVLDAAKWWSTFWASLKRGNDGA